MNCKQCGGIMTVDQKKSMFICPFCGTMEPFDNVSKDELDKAINTIKSENAKMVNKIVESNRKTIEAAKAGAGNPGGNVLVTVLLTIFTILLIIMVAFCFDQDYYAAGIVTCIQLLLISAGFVLKMVNKYKNKPVLSLLSNMFSIVALIMIVVWCIAIGMKPDYDKYTEEKAWPTIGMGSDLPEPDKPAYDLYNTERYLSARIAGVDKTFFEDYINKCKEAGYNIDAKLENKTYTAYNDKDDELILYFFYDNELTITMNKALQFTDFYWPKSGGLQFVPEPHSDKICVESLSDTSARLNVGNVSKKYMLEYIEECKEAGFSGSYNDQDESFYGQKDDVSLKIILKRGNIMYFDTYMYKK